MKETFIIQLCKQDEDYTTVHLNSISGSVYTASLPHKDGAQVMKEIFSIVKNNPVQIEEIEVKAM